MGVVEGGELAEDAVVVEGRECSFLRCDGAEEALHVS